MPVSFISEPIIPVEGTFDARGMARGEPGLPQKFRWREKEFAVTEVLGQGKEYGSCRHGSGERYVRRHSYRVGTTDGAVMNIYFQRSAGKGKLTVRARWWIQSIEDCAAAFATTK
jgi:hypothetical protein